MRAAVLLACLLSTSASAKDGDALGRLFLSPQERLVMEKQRGSQEPVHRVSGFVKPARRPGTIWVDGLTVTESSGGPHIDARRAMVSVPQSPGEPVRYRVGTSSRQGDSGASRP